MEALNSIGEELLDEKIKEYEESCSAGRLFDPDFPQQTAFILDPARLKALFCTRRAAKSYTSGLYLVKEALEHPGCNCLFLGLTRSSAEGIIWKDILKEIDRNNNLGIVFNETDLTATLPNGSVIWVTGADARSDEMNKLLGRKYRLVVIDEASFWSVDCRLLVYGILKPAVADDRGTICMMGTAGNLTEGLFFDITNNLEPGWKLFQWTAHDNHHIAKQWQEELDDIKANRPLFMETALFKQWYLNCWVIDEDSKVYKFNELRNSIPALPSHLSEWRYVLGLDLAHSPDSSSFVVGAYHEGHPILYFVYSYKATQMDLTDVSEKVHELEEIYKFEIKVVDGANKQAVAELNNRHKLNLIPADKTGKVDFIKIMNDEFVQAKIFLLPPTQDLKAEYKKLIWVTDSNGKIKEPRVENPIIHNDCCDSGLYLWRHCYQYIQTFMQQKNWINPHNQVQWESEHVQKLQEQIKREQNKNELDLQWEDCWDSQDEEFQ